MSFVVISTVKFPIKLKNEVQAVGIEMIPVAEKQPGFVSVNIHESSDQMETMMYWVWKSKADHEAFRQSRDWAVVMEKSGSLFQTEGVRFSTRTYLRLT